MQLPSVRSSSRDVLRANDEVDNHYSKEERRRTGRYVAGGAAVVIILLALHHVFARGASSSIAGICVPAIFMIIYIIWVLYMARRDRLMALRLESAMRLAEVNDGSTVCNIDNSNSAIGQPKNLSDLDKSIV